jgi:probable phosphoglycerate mutase
MGATVSGRALEILLVRHGETDWNSQRRIQGQLDVPLNQTGRDQARAVAAHLVGTAIDAIYASDLARASQTAEPIAAALGLDVRIDPRLRERHFGSLQGRFYEELQRESPEAHRRMQSRDLDFNLGGGETLPRFHERVCGALSDLAARHPQGRVVVVSHGGVLDCLYRLSSGLPLEAPRTWGLFNASLNTLAWADGACRVVSWGDVGHLAAPADEIDTRLLN